MSRPTREVQRKRNNVASMLAMQAELAKRPCTYADLVSISGLGRTAVVRWVKSMRAARAVHIASWAADRCGRLFVPAFMLGVGADVSRPGQRRTAAERMAALRAARAGTTSTLRVSV